jgi:hypothetical protein
VVSRKDNTYSLLRRLASQNILGIIVLASFGVVGVLLVTRSMAATPYISSEAESGTLTSPAVSVADGTASGGTAVRFGVPVTQSSGFVHPGIHLNRPQLDFVKARTSQEPWLSAFNKVKSNIYSRSTRVPAPVTSVECGNGAQKARQIGCAALQGDAVAAYNNALLWYYTGDQAYASKAISFMNAWSSTLQQIPWNGTELYGNNKLVAGWAGANWTRAAEIIRYSNAGWSSADIGRFESMLTTKFLPITIDGWTGGGFNWMTLLADVTMSIGVFTNNRATFDNGVGDWRVAVPAHVYTTSDGATPIKAPYGNSNITTYWNGATTFNNGQTQETCRDLGHTGMGLASIFTAAETARIQGIDLYTEQQPRLTAALELQSRLIEMRTAKDADPNYAIPSTICGGALNWGGAAAKMTGDIAHNHYVNRKGLSLPKLDAFVKQYRPLPFGTSDLHMQNETLTNADSGGVPAQ